MFKLDHLLSDLGEEVTTPVDSDLGARASVLPRTATICGTNNDTSRVGKAAKKAEEEQVDLHVNTK